MLLRVRQEDMDVLDVVHGAAQLPRHAPRCSWLLCRNYLHSMLAANSLPRHLLSICRGMAAFGQANQVDFEVDGKFEVQIGIP